MKAAKLDAGISAIPMSIKCKNFSLSKENLKAIKRHLSSLGERAPFNSKIRLLLEKEGSIIKGVLRINSFSNNFQSAHASVEAFDLLGKLITDIDSQLREWKRNRIFTQTLVHHIRTHSTC